jgi:SAM-dependent methyltransferase
VKKAMESLYNEDLAYIHAAAFGGFAQGAAPEIVRLLKSAPIPVRRVVDLGCGAGALSAILVRAGFQVIGIDRSAGLLAIARREVPGAEFVNESMYRAEIPPCEAVVALGEPLTYHSEESDADGLVDGLFLRISGVLPRGGLLIFDVIETGEPSLAGRTWVAGADWAVLVETSEDPGRRLLFRKIETFRRVNQLYRRGREVHRICCFDPAVLTAHLAACGFVAQTAQTYGAQPLLTRRRAFFCNRD